MGIDKHIYLGPFISVRVPINIGIEVNDVLSILEVDKYYSNNSCGWYPKTKDEEYYQLALMPNKTKNEYNRVVELSTFDEPVTFDMMSGENKLSSEDELCNFYKYCQKDLVLIEDKFKQCRVNLCWGLVIYFN